jgi:N-carbamoylputrescine amidase
MASKVGDVKGNVEKACHLIEEVAQQGAKLVCLPELFNTGYFPRPGGVHPDHWDLAEPIEGSWTLTRIGDVAKKHGLCIVTPFAEKAGHGLYHNSAAVVDPEGKVIGCYRKVHVPWSSIGWEKFYFRSGYDFPVFHTPGAKVGIQICYDRNFPEGFRTLALRGAELILLPTATSPDLTELWRMLCRVRAAENALFVLGVGMAGKAEAGHPGFAGNSILAGPGGDLVAALDAEEGLLLADIDIGAIDVARRKRFNLRDRRPELYTKLTEMI